MLVGSRAGLLDTRLDLAQKGATLLAVAGEVGQARASIAGKWADEAVKLMQVSGGSFV